jgi:hypothetical protein
VILEDSRKGSINTDGVEKDNLPPFSIRKSEGGSEKSLNKGVFSHKEKDGSKADNLSKNHSSSSKVGVTKTMT